jgi:hypothetical protein
LTAGATLLSKHAVSPAKENRRSSYMYVMRNDNLLPSADNIVK